MPTRGSARLAGSSCPERLAIGRSRRPSAPDSGRVAGSGDDVDGVPGAPVAGPVPGPDPDVVVGATTPGRGVTGLGRRAPRHPVSPTAPGLDVEVAQPCGQDLEAGVGARPVDRDADVSGIDRSLRDRPEPRPGARLVALLDEDAGEVALAAGG